MSTDSRGADSRGADAVSAEAVGSGAVDSGAVDSGAVDSGAVDSDARDSDARDSDAMGSDPMGSDPMGAKACGAPGAETGTATYGAATEKPAVGGRGAEESAVGGRGARGVVVGGQRTACGPLDGHAADKARIVAKLRAARRHGNRRTALVCSVLAVLVVALLAGSLLLGGLRRIDAADVLPAALGLRTGLADYTIFQIRMPRALAALLAGALFGLSGALYQRLIRNPLATPDVVGITAASGAGAATVIVLLPTASLASPLAAVAGAFLLVGAVHTLSWRRGVDTYRLVLIGIGLSGLCTAYMNYVFTLADQHSIAILMRWLIGSVNGVAWDGVRTLAVALFVCLAATAALARSLGGMTLGDDLATGLGTPVGRVRIAVLLLGAVAAALATAVVGPIGFVSLVSGPIAVRLVGADRAVGLSVPIGAVLVLGADVLAQHAPLVSPVPTGVLTALLGAPYFVWLILRRRQGASS